MIYQNSLDPNIAHIACYFDSLAHGRKDYEWTARELNDLFFLCKKLGYIDESDCIYSPGMVAKTLKTNLIFIGKKYLDYKPLKEDYVIGCFKMDPIAVNAHFVVMDNSGIYTKEHVIMDPWEGGARTTREGLCTSLRIFRRVE